jgi:crotonobetainyl-CoA:carnitine CoA-transferase CaiB-like acyl-CoA transferase
MISTGVFETADGYINVAVTGQVMWERLCNAIGGRACSITRLQNGEAPAKEPGRTQRRNREPAADPDQRGMDETF